MSSVRVRRAAALGLTLALAVSGMALADTVAADGDAVTTGAQTSVDLGTVPPGAIVPVDVAFVLTCKGISHVSAGSAISIAASSWTWPEDGSATATSGSITVPAGWPAAGADCPASGLVTTGATPAHLSLTAPTVVGTGYEFSFLFSATPPDGVTNLIGFSARMDVGQPAPSDTTPPVLVGLPVDMTAFTPGTSAVVSYATPTATDDTDPDPQVACAPASGSTFALGDTTVTCTATDAAGNTSQGTFVVTVRQLAGTWGRPLSDGEVPALVGQPGRTIPVKLDLVSGGAAQGPGQVDAPALALDRLTACAAGAASVETRPAGAFAWTDGTWQLDLKTAGMLAGCWRLTATVDGAPAADAVVLLTSNASAQASHTLAPVRPGR